MSFLQKDNRQHLPHPPVPCPLSPVIELRNITKQYLHSNKKANNNISIDLQSGEILCIAGENGAGKTTLMKILCGLEMPDSGEIYVNKKKQAIKSPIAAKRLGIGMLHQHFMLFPEYTVAENIVIGFEQHRWGVFFDVKSANKQAEKIINEHGFALKSTLKVKDLTLGQMQQVEICRILYQNAQIIILDEPTSILTEQEIQSLFKTLRNLVSEGKTVVLITHKLPEIKRICNRVAVLRHGELAGVLEGDEIEGCKIAALMTGSKRGGAADDSYYHTGDDNHRTSEPLSLNVPIISFENVTVKRRNQMHPLLDKVSFSVHSGEILGFTGVGGNGLGVIEAVLGGFLHPAEGKIFHRGKDISDFSIRRLRKEGLCFIPADRLNIGSARDATIEENMIINRRNEFIKGIFFNNKAVNEFTGKLAQSYNMADIVFNEKCSTLSGGNLQKLILAREIDCFKDYIVFSEPTWGLDIASSRFMMEEINVLRGRGAAVIFISTNLDEILALSDRVIVMYRGKIAGEFTNGDELIKDKINNSMIGMIING